MVGMATAGKRQRREEDGDAARDQPELADTM